MFQVEDNGFLLLPISREHIVQTQSLPFHHRDPFDRLLIATALREDLTIATKDEKMSAYGVSCVW